MDINLILTHSEQITDIAVALAGAQGEYEAATKDQTNPHFGRQYADLASGLNACRAALSKYQVAVIQAPCSETVGEGDSEYCNAHVVTMLVHASGQWFKSALTMPCERIHAQGIGSAITYARRYALFAMVGIAPEDDDGNGAAAKDDNGNGAAAKDDKPAQRRQEPARAPVGNGGGTKDARFTGEQLEEYKRLAKALNLSAADAGSIVRDVAGCAPAGLTLSTMANVIVKLQSMLPQNADGAEAPLKLEPEAAAEAPQ